MNCEGYGMKHPWPNQDISKYLLGGTEENHENRSQNSWCPGQDMSYVVRKNSNSHGFLQSFHTGCYLN
jgi:hypothetical protein